MASSERALSGAQSTPAPSVTPVGVDVGEYTLAAVAPADAAASDALLVDGEHVRESFRLMRTITTTLEQFATDTEPAETAVVAAFWTRLKGQIFDAAARVVEYAQSFPGAVLVLEEIPQTERPLFEHRHVVDNLGAWLLPALQAAIVDRATADGVPVARVHAKFTSQECHACGEIGDRSRSGRTLRCTTDDCSVDEVDADASAAVTIASRLDEYRTLKYP